MFIFACTSLTLIQTPSLPFSRGDGISQVPVDHGAFYEPLAAVLRVGSALGPRQVNQAQLAALDRVPTATSTNAASAAPPSSGCSFPHCLLVVGSSLLLHANLGPKRNEEKEVRVRCTPQPLSWFLDRKTGEGILHLIQHTTINITELKIPAARRGSGWTRDWPQCPRCGAGRCPRALKP